MGIGLVEIIERDIERIKQQLEVRCLEVSMELKSASKSVLNQPGTGRVYHGHVASAPGQPPAPDTGAYRDNWCPTVDISGGSYISRIESNLKVGKYHQGTLLENGTKRMAPRPHEKKILEKALPNAIRIYSEPYL